MGRRFGFLILLRSGKEDQRKTIDLRELSENNRKEGGLDSIIYVRGEEKEVKEEKRIEYVESNALL